MTKSEARHGLWAIGQPGRYLFDNNQRGVVERFRKRSGPEVWLWSRQLGKSYMFFALAHEVMLQKPEAIVRYCARTKDSAWSIALPNLGRIWADCPEELKPKPNPKRTDELVMAHNGSKLVIFGTDAQSFDKGRGPFTDLIGLDECGFYQDLEGVESALLPSLQTTGGRVVYLSTPSESPAHPYALRCQAARARRALEHGTIYDNPRIDVEQVIRDECDRLGLSREQLLQSTYWRREYMAEWVTEESRAAVPVWNRALEEQVTKEHQRPAHYSALVSCDWGGHEGDPHAALFGYLDFTASKLVIEEEFERHGGTLTELVYAWKETERRLWGVEKWEGTLLGAGAFEKATRELPSYLKRSMSDRAPKQPYLRVSDHNDGFQAEMIQQHGYALLPTEKPDKHIHVDHLGSLLAAHRIVIHPRCVRLREQLYSTLWDKARSRWERTPRDHGDLLDCLVYMSRHAPWHRDPRPPQPDDMWTNEKKRESRETRLAQAFGGMRRRT